jgi:hypothetical protein
MKTLAESYASKYGGSPTDAGQRLFWRCLYRRAVPFLPILFLLRPRHFQPDRDLVERAAGARSLRQVNEEINDYRSDPANLHWLRQHANLRLSTRRLQHIARDCFASPGPAAAPGKESGPSRDW